MPGLTLPRVTVEMALPSNPQDVSPIWVNVTNTSLPDSGLLSIKTNRGRQHELSQMQAGTAVLRYRNVNDFWSPWNTASPIYGNLLTANQASLETDTVGWAAQASTSIQRNVAHFLNGAASLQMQRTGTSGTAAAVTTTGTGGVRADPKQQFSALAWFQADTTGRASTVSILWYDQFGAQISGDSGTPVTSNTGGWVQATVTATAPAGTSYMAVQVSAAGCVATEVHYVDQIGLNGGGTGLLGWGPGGLGSLIQPMKKTRVRADWNYLTAQQASLEAVGTAGWAENAAGFVTIARNTGHFLSGAASLQMQRITASGDIAVVTPTGQSGMIVAAGQSYTAMAFFQADTTGRSSDVTILWYSSGGTFISASTGGSVTDNSGGWVQATVTATAPAAANYAAVQLGVHGCVATEIHYADQMGLFPAANITVWSAGGTYYQLTGYVQEIKQVWPDPANAEVEITVVDGFKVLNLSQIISTAYKDAVTVDTPAGYYSLNETTNSTPDGSGVILAVDGSGNLYNGSYRGAPGYGANGALPAEVGTGVDLGVRAAYVDLSLGPTPSGTGNFTIEAWVNPRTWPAAAYDDKIYSKRAFSGHNIQLSINTDGKLRFFVSDGTNGGTLDTTTALTLRRWNHVAAVKIGTTGPANWKIYINGTEVSTGAVLLGTGNANIAADTSMIGGRILAGNPAPAFDGSIDEFATYFSALTSTRITAHYNAAYGLTANSLGGARIGNLLDLIGWPAADRSLATGQFQLQGVTQSLYTTPSLSYILQAVESEGYPAAFFMNGQGFAVFQDRANSTPASSGTFGDASNELHYILDSQSVPVRDDLDIWTTVVCQATGGAAQTVSDATAQGRFVKRTLSKTGLLNASDADVLTLATALLARYKDARDRAKTVRLQPNTDPGNLFPVCLGAEINNRYTVNRHRTLGSGAALSLDTRCEGIAHDIDFTTGNWFTTLMLIPT